MEYVAGEEGFLHEYLTYARGLTDAPLAFHCAAGLVALAGAVGSQVSWVGGGGRENWPSIYVLLLAPSGMYRKSTSVDLACTLLERACPNRVMDREFSPERFIRNLATTPTCVLKEAEFSSLLERMKANYMMGLKQRLTELYDCIPSYDRTINGGAAATGGDRISIKRPALSILAASTTDWLVASLTEMDLRSGFIPRFLLFPGSMREPEPPGGYWAAQNNARESGLVGMLRDVANLGTVHVNVSDVREHLVKWDTKMRARYDETTMGDISGVYSRLAHGAAKLCALLAVSELAPVKHGPHWEYVVPPALAARATALMEWVLDATERVFSESLVFEKFEQLVQRFLQLVKEDGTDRSIALKNMHVDSRTLDRIVDACVERGEIDIQKTPTGGRLRVTYHPTEELKRKRNGKTTLLIEEPTDRTPLLEVMPW